MSIVVQYIRHSSILSPSSKSLSTIILVSTHNHPSPSPCQTAPQSRHKAPHHLSPHHPTYEPSPDFFLLGQFNLVLLQTPAQSASIAPTKPLVLCPVKRNTTSSPCFTPLSAIKAGNSLSLFLFCPDLTLSSSFPCLHARTSSPSRLTTATAWAVYSSAPSLWKRMR